MNEPILTHEVVTTSKGKQWRVSLNNKEIIDEDFIICLIKLGYGECSAIDYWEKNIRYKDFNK